MNSTPLSLPYSRIQADKGGNLCTRMGVVFAIGGSMVIALHTHSIAGLSCKQQQPLSRRWNVAVGRFHAVFVSPSPPCLFLKTCFRVFFFTYTIVEEMAKKWLCCFQVFWVWSSQRKGSLQKLKKISHYSITPMWKERWVKFWSPQNTSGASQSNSIASSCLTTEVKGDFF